MFPDSFETARLILRPMREDDAQAIFDAYGQNPEVTRYLTWRPVERIEQTRSFVEMNLRSQISRSYMLQLKTAGEVIGSFDLRKPGHGKIEFGYVLARPHWGRGLMTEALSQVVGWALAQPSIWRIGAVADVENVGSMRVMEKAGLHREGVLRRWLVHPNLDDAPRDCVSFARTR
jgi:[ribosomal protein S5]-alanine N-acetyltransferase